MGELRVCDRCQSRWQCTKSRMEILWGLTTAILQKNVKNPTEMISPVIESPNKVGSTCFSVTSTSNIYIRETSKSNPEGNLHKRIWLQLAALLSFLFGGLHTPN
jgi:hypothetical protein